MENKLIALNLLNDEINLELFYDINLCSEIRLQGRSNKNNPLELQKKLHGIFVFDNENGWLRLKTEFHKETLIVTLTF